MDTIAFAEFNEIVNSSAWLPQEVSKMIYDLSGYKDSRKVYIESHVPNNKNNCKYIQNIHAEKITPWRGDSGKWTQVIEERTLGDNEIFVESDEYSASGIGGNCYNSRIFKLRNVKDKDRYLGIVSSIVSRKEEIKKKLKKYNKEKRRLEKILNGLYLTEDWGRGPNTQMKNKDSIETDYKDSVHDADAVLSHRT